MTDGENKPRDFAPIGGVFLRGPDQEPVPALVVWLNEWQIYDLPVPSGDKGGELQDGWKALVVFDPAWVTRLAVIAGRLFGPETLAQLVDEAEANTEAFPPTAIEPRSLGPCLAAKSLARKHKLDQILKNFWLDPDPEDKDLL